MPPDRTATVAAGAGTTTICTAAPGGGGQLRRVLVTAVGTGTATIYDNTAGSGTIIGIVPASAAAGTVYAFEMPFFAGITVVNAASGPGLTIGFVD